MLVPSPLGLLGAMDVEVSAVVAALEAPSQLNVLGHTVVDGRLCGHRVLVACSGIGKVNAALATAALAQAGALAVVLVGMAGATGPAVHIGDAVVATELIQHDVDITALGDAPGFINGRPAGGTPDARLSDAIAAGAAQLGANVHRGLIASADQFVASPQQSLDIAARFDAVAVEMEGASVAQACGHLGLPFAVLRWISDAADEAAPADFPAFADRVAQLDLAVIQTLLQG